MNCPFCQNPESRVLETRVQKDGELRRRRECLKCEGRFTTIETLYVKMPYVVKKDGAREPFDVEKLRRGLQLACLKRPVSLPQIEDIVGRIRAKVLGRNDKEIQSLEIGHMVMKELKGLDDVAYVRFASVYKNFRDVQEFVKTLETEIHVPDDNKQVDLT